MYSTISTWRSDNIYFLSVIKIILAEVGSLYEEPLYAPNFFIGIQAMDYHPQQDALRTTLPSIEKRRVAEYWHAIAYINTARYSETISWPARII